MAAVIRRITVTPPVNGVAVRVIPPPNVDPPIGTTHWTVLNLDTGKTVELLDDAAKNVGGGLPVAAGQSWDSMSGRAGVVYAAVDTGSADVAVSGTPV